MSFHLTEQQFVDGTKDVTRRVGWSQLKPGARLRAVRKAMGLRKGEKQHVLGHIEVLSVRREPLCLIDQEDCRREGFPDMTPAEFVEMFCQANPCEPTQVITRIEFRKVDAEGGP
jgi:hypothetical protein